MFLNTKKLIQHIDSIQNIEEVKLISSLNDEGELLAIFWDSFAKVFSTQSELERQKCLAKCKIINDYFGSSIPVQKDINKFNSPHGFHGIFISLQAKIGKNCVIFQNVTIGSNTLPNSKSGGAPTIGDNVYIGAGAEIIGNVKIGNKVRIGAGCFVNRDVPDNCTVIQGAPSVIKSDQPLDNRFISINDYPKTSDNNQANVNGSTLFRVMDSVSQSNYENAFRILFCGDLILLEDQVKRAYKDGKYNFENIFEYTRKYISDADFSIGVFEGSCGGTAKLYSQSNCDDGKYLYLNFPDEFVDAVKNAGFNLVTNANNHILDMGVEGAKRTIKILDEKNLDHIGSYLDEESKNNQRVKIVKRDGIKFAILSYTYGSNYHTTEQLMSEEFSYLTSIIPDPNHANFNIAKEYVRKDFELAKSYNPDFIIVLPHWGTQFEDNPNNFQRVWRDIFLDYGADIILGDHTHSVQPVKIQDYKGRRTFNLYSPGNYANVFQKYDGDASAMVEVYIDRKTKKILGGAIIPMWTQSPLAGNYRALPIYDIVTNEKLAREISTYEMKHVNDVLKHVTKIMLGSEIDKNLIQPRYYFDENGFQRKKSESIQIDENIMNGKFFQCLKAANDVCFIGDSLTHGTSNGGVSWYEPLESLIKGQVINISVGGATTKMLIHPNNLKFISQVKADLFVIAIGTNDVRYRNENICAMTEEEYIRSLQILRTSISMNQPNAKFVFIAPWTSTDGDKNSALPYQLKMTMNEKYTQALKFFCNINRDTFINANPYIKKVLNNYPHSEYLVDFIHPNATKGVQMYSKAVLNFKG